MIFSQWTSMMMATAGMTSPKGRCHTFDARADGYARGEGIYAISLRASGDATRPVMHGCAIQQDGKSASLTAPNGQAQSQLMRAGMADAGSPPSELSSYEAHGTGTPLGDPIEVRSTKAAVLAGRDGAEPLQLGSVKANCGHGEPAAGVLGILRLALGLMLGQAPPNAQLRTINEHVLSAMDDTRAGALPVQLAALPEVATRCSSRAGSVSSFGYSGTIGSAVVEAPVVSGVAEMVPSDAGPAYVRKRYLWMEMPNPLIHSRVKGEGGASQDAFCSPVKGALRSLVSDHVVQGRVVFPGAGYLEMARAAVCAVTEGSAATLKRVCFLKPLVLDDAENGSVTIAIDTNADRFELSSTGEDAQTVTHSAGDAEASSTTLSAPAAAAALGSSYAAVDVGVFYDAFLLRRPRVRPRVPPPSGALGESWRGGRSWQASPARQLLRHQGAPSGPGRRATADGTAR